MVAGKCLILRKLRVDRVEILRPADTSQREAADRDELGALGLGRGGGEIG